MYTKAQESNSAFANYQYLKVYQVVFDKTRYRPLTPVNKARLNDPELYIDGNSKADNWTGPLIRYDGDDSRAIPDVSVITEGFFVFNEWALDCVGQLLKTSGELLEIPVNSERHFAFNPLIKIDCLEMDAAVWIAKEGGGRELMMPVFDRSKLKSTRV